jgi:integrase
MLTDAKCRNARKAEKPQKLADAHGLYLYVTTTGFRSWRMKYRFGNKERRLTFGGYPDVSLEDAREMRNAARILLRGGIDPTVERKQREATVTAESLRLFEPIARAWHTAQTPIWSPRYSAKALASMEKDIFPELGKVPIGSITVPMVLKALRAVEERAAVETAHRLRQHMSETFLYAIGAGLTETDPAHVVKPALLPMVKGRRPAVRLASEATAVLAKVEAMDAFPATKLASRLLALTVARPGVIRMAAPQEFEGLDSTSPVWRVPAEKMKLTVERKNDADFEFVIPLSTQAVQVVRVALHRFGNGPLLFPSVSSPKNPLSDNTLSKLYRDAGQRGRHVPHGWRATFSTVMNELAAAEDRTGDRAVIDLMLAHLPTGMSAWEAAYNRAMYMPRRRVIAQTWADLLILDLQPAQQLAERAAP